MRSTRAGSYLNNRARALGYLDAHGQIAAAHRQEFLNLRYNPQDSISAAAENAARNLAILKANKMIRDTSVGAMAHYAYMAHHEGVAGAAKFINGGISVSRKQFNANVPQTHRAAYLAANGNDLTRAYRAYMSDYIDQRIDVRRYMVNPAGVTVSATNALLDPIQVPPPRAKKPAPRAPLTRPEQKGIIAPIHRAPPKG